MTTGRVLGIDTSTQVGGAGLVDGTTLVGEYTLNIQRSTHSERLMPAVARILTDAGWSGRDLHGVAVAVGPGSFTGLRIGVATAKALAYAWSKPVVGINTLTALAWQAAGRVGAILALVDARQDRVYAALYRWPTIHQAADPAEVLLAPVACTVGQLVDWLRGEAAAPLAPASAGASAVQMNAGAVAPEDEEPITLVGDGVVPHWDFLRERLGPRVARLPVGSEILHSGSVAALGARRLAGGEADDVFALKPAYLKKSEAERSWRKRNNSR